VPAIIFGSAPPLTSVGDYIFRIYPSDAFQGKEAAKFIYQEYNKPKAAVIYVKNAWGEGLRNVFVEEYEKMGGEVVYEGNVLATDIDLKTEMVKLKDSGAEALYFPVYPASAVAGLKQMQEMELEVTVVDGDAFASDEVITSGYADGTIYSLAEMGLPDDFKTKIQNLEGFEIIDVNAMAPLGYDAIKIFADVMKKAGTDQKIIRDELAKISHKGVSNPKIEFDEVGDLNSALFEFRIIRDKETYLYR